MGGSKGNEAGTRRGMRARAETLVAHAVSFAPLSYAMGRVSDLPLPPRVMGGIVRLYARAFGIPRSDLDRPPEAYACLNAFFTRGLAPGRMLPELPPDALASPADGVLDALGHLDGADRFVVKGQVIDLAGLTWEPDAAQRFAGGTFALVYLSPRNYHRVHATVSGRLTGFRYIPGRLFPVNELGVRNVPGMFLRNERIVLFFDTPYGAVWEILVGASFVGRMGLAHDDFVTNDRIRKLPLERRYDPPKPVRVGEEVGRFNLGSTVVVLAASRAALSLVAEGGEVKVGELLGRLAPPDTGA